MECATNNYYPIYFTHYTTFEEETTPTLFSGYIDALDNVYENEEEASNTFFNSDDFLKRIYLSKNSFGLSNNVNYFIDDIEFLSDTTGIEPFVKDKNSLIIDINSNFNENSEQTIDIHAKKDIEQVVQNKSALHSGWVYVGENDYYIYSNPVTDSANWFFL